MRLKCGAYPRVRKDAKFNKIMLVATAYSFFRRVLHVRVHMHEPSGGRGHASASAFYLTLRSFRRSHEFYCDKLT